MTAGEESNIETDQSMISTQKVIIFVIFSVIVFAFVGLYGQLDAVALALASIPWWWVLPTMMVLSFLNYIIRYVKWQYYLSRIDIHLSHKDSFSVFIAGFTLTTTPGKIGEAIKGYFIRDIDGTPVAKTIPVVVSERVTDLLALVLLAMIGFGIGVNTGDQLLTVLMLGGVVFVAAIVLSQKTFYRKILKRFTSIGPLKRFQDNFDDIEHTMTRTLGPKPLVVSTIVSLPGWFMECLELWLLLSLLTGAGLPSLGSASLILLLQATFVHSTASIIGALSFLPGGVGTYEFTSIALITFLLGITPDLASAATILIRVVTLWFSVIVGFVALGVVTRSTRRRRTTSELSDSS
ncbi:MAG: flippase-like domain-containing protein [Candidatus Thorarchaeota archaeon]|nr:flippase-like domain-containing protein [Candidatus Thorarchaeota archaeon]